MQIVDNTGAVTERAGVRRMKINYLNPLTPTFSLEGEGACGNI
jgi:hypothetical protein